MAQCPHDLNLQIVQRDPKSLHQYQANARTHSQDQISKIAASIEKFGFLDPIAIDRSGQIIAGHGRAEAAILLGMKAVPTIVLSHLNDQEQRAYLIAHNRLAELAGWDEEILRIELGELSVCEDVEITDTGFTVGEVDALLMIDEASDDPDDLINTACDGPPLTREGDIWALGDHKVVCGDALNLEVIASLMDGEKARLILTDPPYNVPVNGHVSSSGKHAEFAYAVGEMSSEEFTGFLTQSFKNGREVLLDGGLFYGFIDWRHIREMSDACETVFDQALNVCVWDKQVPGMGSLYRSQHELCVIYKHGKAVHVNNIELGKHGRNRSNVWAHRGATGFSKTREKDLGDHPTVKPVGLLGEAILDVTCPGEIVLDLFAGSGSVLLAAQRTRRVARLVEYEPGYVDVILRRWVDRYGSEPFHLPSGKPLGAVIDERLSSEEAEIMKNRFGKIFKGAA